MGRGRRLKLTQRAIVRSLIRPRASSFVASYRHCLTLFVRVFLMFCDLQYQSKIVSRRSDSTFCGTYDSCA